MPKNTEEPEDLMKNDKPKELKGYPRKDETDLENLPEDWLEEDAVIAGRKPDLGEQEEDEAEL